MYLNLSIHLNKVHKWRQSEKLDTKAKCQFFRELGPLFQSLLLSLRLGSAWTKQPPALKWQEMNTQTRAFLALFETKP